MAQGSGYDAVLTEDGPVRHLGLSQLRVLRVHIVADFLVWSNRSSFRRGGLICHRRGNWDLLCIGDSAWNTVQNPQWLVERVLVDVGVAGKGGEGREGERTREERSGLEIRCRRENGMVGRQRRKEDGKREGRGKSEKDSVANDSASDHT